MELITEAIVVCKRRTIDGIDIFPVGSINALDPSLDEGPGLQYFSIRQRYSNNEKFFVIGKRNHDDEDMREHIYNLIEKNIESTLYTYI